MICFVTIKSFILLKFVFNFICDIWRRSLLLFLVAGKSAVALRSLEEEVLRKVPPTHLPERFGALHRSLPFAEVEEERSLAVLC